jgi:TetR/AcrR family transcriptional regulator, transcriptional repressor for nem operon
MSPRTDTRDKILKSADRLMRSRGFNGFSYHDIAKPLGIRNAAVHYHFATKADLGVAVIDEIRAFLRNRTAAFMAGQGDPVEQLEGYIAYASAECCEHHTICPVGALSADYYTLPEPVREAGRRLVEEVLAWMTRVCTVGREQAKFRFEGDPSAKGLQIMTSLQGARQLTRFRPSAIQEVAAQIRRDLGLDPA